MILHLKLCVQMKRSRGLHYTQVPRHILSAGTLHMVSEHCVACRFETLDMDRNRFDHRIKIYFIQVTKNKTFHFIFLVLSSTINLLENSYLILDDLLLCIYEDMFGDDQE